MSPELQSVDNTLAIIRSAGHAVTAEDEADYRALFAELERRLGRGAPGVRPEKADTRPAPTGLSHMGTADYMADLMLLMRAILTDHPEWHDAAARISRAYAEIVAEALISGQQRTLH